MLQQYNKGPLRRLLDFEPINDINCYGHWHSFVKTTESADLKKLNPVVGYVVSHVRIGMQQIYTGKGAQVFGFI